uniref:Uncharacterized protein n=1 Tax=Oryza sativa subsp. japonica TaxID=39947 RepID=Q9AY45_ORYSJ|nr:hypothetical protein [Oryza sativa Japonica Group]
MTFLMSFFGILVPGVPANCIGDIADAPAADIGGKDDDGAATGGTTVDGTGAAGGTVAGAGAGAGAGVGSGGGRGFARHWMNSSSNKNRCLASLGSGAGIASGSITQQAPAKRAAAAGGAAAAAAYSAFPFALALRRRGQK